MDENLRCGVTACGYYVLDRIRQIDAWPQEEGLAEVLEESAHNGGGPSNVLADLSRLGADFPLRAVGRVGDDEAGRQIMANAEKDGVDISALTVLPYIDYLFFNEQECARLTGVHARESDQPRQAEVLQASKNCMRWG